MIDPRVYIVAGAVAIGFGAGWIVNGWRGDAQLANLKAAHNGIVAAANAATVAAFKNGEARRQVLETERDAIDLIKTAELKRTQDELQTLRDGVADGTIGLRVNATCPRSPSHVSAGPGAARVDDGAAARLTPDAEQNYFRLLDGLATMTKQVEGLQEIIRSRARARP